MTERMKIVFPLKVEIAGSWSSWEPQPCELNQGGGCQIDLNIPAGCYDYKLLVNGVRCLDQTQPTSTNQRGEQYNLLTVKDGRHQVLTKFSNEDQEKVPELEHILAHDDDIEIIGKIGNDQSECVEPQKTAKESTESVNKEDQVKQSVVSLEETSVKNDDQEKENVTKDDQEEENVKKDDQEEENVTKEDQEEENVKNDDQEEENVKKDDQEEENVKKDDQEEENVTNGEVEPELEKPCRVFECEKVTESSSKCENTENVVDFEVSNDKSENVEVSNDKSENAGVPEYKSEPAEKNTERNDTKSPNSEGQEETEPAGLDIKLDWRVQIVGNWNESYRTSLDCKILGNGSLAVSFPDLPAGEHEYKFLINGSEFVDESLPNRKSLFKHCNLLRVSEKREVIMR